MKKLPLLFSLIFGIQICVPFTSVDAAPAQYKLVQDLSYVPGSKNKYQKLDLYLPPGSAPKNGFPLIIQFHGGAWTTGDKRAVILLPAFIKAGFAVASVDYRLVSELRFPAQIYDVKAAVRFLRSISKQKGIDPDRFGAIGGSSGGHLAALLGASNGVASLEGNLGNAGQSSSISAVCELAGPSNFFSLDLPQRYLPKNGVLLKPSMHLYPDSSTTLTKKLLGATAKEAPDKARLASPVCWVSKSTAPFLIIHGEKDSAVPLSQSVELTTILKQNNVPVTLVVVPGAEHAFNGGPKLDEQILQFFKTHLQAH